jgi:hypothetical protein
MTHPLIGQFRFTRSEWPHGSEQDGARHLGPMNRISHHPWYHIGEIPAIRRMLAQKNLPEYVGDIETEASYRPK